MKRLAERARVVSDVRAFFDARDFLHVDTPAIVPSPGMDTHLDAFAVDLGRGRTRWLATSPEYQMKRVLADGHSRVYQVCRAYRRDEQGHLHSPEFTMLEWYRSGAGVEDVMRDTEQLVARVTGGSIRTANRRVGALPPFPRITVIEAFRSFAGLSEDETLHAAAHDEDRFFRLLVDKVEPALAAQDTCVFLTDYPSEMASLARKKPSDPRVAERFELYAAGVELCNGFGELVDPVEQRARFEADQRVRADKGLAVYPIDDKLIDALAALPPSAGNALGLDRLAMLATSSESIDEVLAFTWSEL